MDLQLGRGVSSIASYVALTRVGKREDLLIYREFDRAPFICGPPEGPTLLLRKLRGEKIDWEKIEAQHTPKSKCDGCFEVRYKEDFATRQWQAKRPHFCKICEDKRKAEMQFQCARCSAWLFAVQYSPYQLQRAHQRWCLTCSKNDHENKVCSVCLKYKTRWAYSYGQWGQKVERKCRICELPLKPARKPGYWYCIGCKMQ